ncbi:putative mitochondrial protein, partial [Mucuna pruriens]
MSLRHIRIYQNVVWALQCSKHIPKMYAQHLLGSARGMHGEGIVLSYLVSSRGIEVDKAKVDVITSLPNPTLSMGSALILGHAGFYRRFIKNFSKIALPLSKLLQRDVDFVFDEACVEAF